jgi:hypothetical protein
VKQIELPSERRPKAVTSALADVEAAQDRLREVETQLFEANQRHLDGHRKGVAPSGRRRSLGGCY